MTVAMTVATRSVVTRAEVEDFLYHEAALLDDWKLNEWQDLLTDDAAYYVPPNDQLEADHRSTLFIVADDRERIRRDPRLDPRGPGGFLWHHGSSSIRRILYGIIPDISRRMEVFRAVRLLSGLFHDLRIGIVEVEIARISKPLAEPLIGLARIMETHGR